MSTDHPNGNGGRVEFDANDAGRWLPDHVAAQMLQLWYARDPQHFGALLAEAWTGTPPRTVRVRNRP